MPSRIYNPAMVAPVTAYEYGPEQTDPETGETFRPVIGILPGERPDVQLRCLELHPDLAAFIVEPDTPLHDPGPNGVRLYAESKAPLEAAAPPSVPPHPSDIFIDIPDEEGPTAP